MLLKKKHRDRWATFLLLCLAGGIIGFSSCVPLERFSLSTDVSDPSEKPLRGKIYESEDYIVYRLAGGETPSMLAGAFLGNKDRAWVIEDENKDIPFEKGRFVVIPLKDTGKGGLEPNGFQAVPILCYHSFAKRCRSSMCLSENTFERQMKYLKDHGYRVIKMSEFFEFLQYRQGIPKRSVVITVDDGYRSFYDIAVPILKKYGFRATLFVYTDFIGQSKNALSWDQLKTLKSEGFEIGSHSVSHSDLTKKRPGEDDQAHMARVNKELRLSKKIIDKKIKQDTIYIAFPFGSYNPRILQLAEQAGYRVGLSVKKGTNPFFTDALSLKRNQIMGGNMNHFIEKLVVFKAFDLQEAHAQ